jgi:hypothetical protein
MEHILYLDDRIRKITLFTNNQNIGIFFKEYIQKSAQTHWHNIIEITQDSITLLCLCAWNSNKSSLQLILENHGIIKCKYSIRKVHIDHIHISVYSTTVTPTLTLLCKEYMSLYRFPQEYIVQRSYLTPEVLYPVFSKSLYLVAPYNYSMNSCIGLWYQNVTQL